MVLGLLAGPLGYAGMFVTGSAVTALALFTYVVLVRRGRTSAQGRTA